METLKLDVKLGDRGYPIVIGGWEVFAAYQEYLGPLAADRSGARHVILADAGVIRAHSLPEALGSQLLSTTVSGEPDKSITRLGAIWEELARRGVGRDGLLSAIGGGVTGDLGGFAAASYLRGIPLVQVPTTLLAMVDSSVGGKTGINLEAGKNLVGAFWQPQAVFINTGFLETLPAWEFAAGMAEVIKYGLLGDRALLEQLEAMPAPLTWDHPELPAIIHRCCAIKAEIVAGDERETSAEGGRALLNLGHTFAHAIEKVAGYGVYLHGEAVAIGLVLAAQLSNRLAGTLNTKLCGDVSLPDRVAALLSRYRLPTSVEGPRWRADGPLPPPRLSSEALMAAMQQDKKKRSGQLRFVALAAPGEAVTLDGVPAECVAELWRGAGAV